LGAWSGLVRLTKNCSRRLADLRIRAVRHLQSYDWAHDQIAAAPGRSKTRAAQLLAAASAVTAHR
jgi:hypothetical protein